MRVCRSLRTLVRIAALGDLLFETLGSTDEVTSVVDRIAAMDEANEARRSAILDECWDDVGLEDEGDE